MKHSLVYSYKMKDQTESGAQNNDATNDKAS